MQQERRCVALESTSYVENRDVPNYRLPEQKGTWLVTRHLARRTNDEPGIRLGAPNWRITHRWQVRTEGPKGLWMSAGRPLDNDLCKP